MIVLIVLAYTLSLAYVAFADLTATEVLSDPRLSPLFRDELPSLVVIGDRSVKKHQFLVRWLQLSTNLFLPDATTQV